MLIELLTCYFWLHHWLIVALYSSVMFLVGLTGGIASGKSAVSLMLSLLNCEVIDADKIAREGQLIEH